MFSQRKNPYCELLRLSIANLQNYLLLARKILKMTKILGIDLGVGSIGWALINKQEPDNKIDSFNWGVRVIPLEAEERDSFEKGKTFSKAAERRIKRGARRNLQRYKLRRTKLVALLRANFMLPSTDYFQLSSLELYAMRCKAIKEALPLEAIGRVLMHINQKRGYLSNRKVQNEEESKSDYLQKIQNNAAQLGLDAPTIGTLFYYELLQNPLAKLKKRIFLRKNYLDEVIQIWNFQKQFYPDVLTDTLFKQIVTDTIFHQRPLKSAKDLLSKCRYETQKRVIPRSHPLAQEVKLWQDINKLMLYDDQKVPIAIEPAMRELLFNELSFKKEISENNLFKIFGIHKLNGITSNLKSGKIQGNLTLTALLTALKEAGINEQEAKTKLRFQPHLHENQFVVQLWHTLYALSDLNQVVAALMRLLPIQEHQANIIAKVGFKTDHAALSAKAMKRILPHLQAGLVYSDACAAAGYEHADAMDKQTMQNRSLLPALPLIKRNEMRNPTVEKIVNQFVNLINDIFQVYGKPDEVVIEYARELKQNKEQRENTFSNNNKRDKLHKSIEERLKSELGFRKVSKADIERYKLWEEFDEVSPYEPNVKIGLHELFTNKFEIEHIIPKSRFFDDSFANKTIASSYINKNKNNLTAYDFMSQLGPEKLNQFEQAIVRNKKLSHKKLKYFKLRGDQIPNDFLNRDLNDTRYISKLIKERLMQCITKVRTTSGAVTDFLRHHWGFDDVLHQVNFNWYKAHGLTEIYTDKNGNKHERITNWSKRLDHRHHAIDAFVIACTTQGMIQKLNNLNQQFANANQAQLKEAITEGWKTYFKNLRPCTVQTLVDKAAQLVVSWKVGKKVATKQKNPVKLQAVIAPKGALHKETVYGKIWVREKLPTLKALQHLDLLVNPIYKQQFKDFLNTHDGNFDLAIKHLKKEPLLNEKGQPIDFLWVYQAAFVVKYKLDQNFKASDTESIVDKRIKHLVKERLKAFNNDPKKAFEHLETKPIWFDANQKISVNTVRCFTGYNDLVPLHKNQLGALIDYVSTGNNHHVAIYQGADGLKTEMTVSLWEAVERQIQGQPIIAPTLPNGQQLVLSMQRNECFVIPSTTDLPAFEELKNNPVWLANNLYRVQKLSSKDYFFRKLYETQIDVSSTARDMRKYLRISSLNSLNIFKVSINRLGMVQFV